MEELLSVDNSLGVELDSLENPTTQQIQQNIQFSLPNMSTNEWRSSSEFNTAGMQLVYQVANLTLNAIFPPHDQYLGYAGYAKEKDYEWEQLLNISRGGWERLIMENKGPLGYILGSALFILFLSCWGVGWLFSKCCCGDKGCCLRCLRGKDSDDLISAKLEQKRDKCKRNFCGVLFATIIVVFMFGLVCCFVTNEQMRMSVDRMPEEVDNSLADVNTYLNTTELQINALFIDNYQLLSTTLNHILDESGEIIKNGLSKRTGAQTLDNLTEIVDIVEEVRSNVISVEKSSKGLKEKVERLKNGLTDSKARLLALLDQCQSQKCLELKTMPEIRSLRVQNEFQNLPNMTEILRELSLLLGTDVRKSIEDGRRSFDELGRRIKEEVEPILPDIRILIDDTGKELGAVAQSLTKALHSIPVDDGRDMVKDYEVEIKKYAPFRYYAVLGVCLTLSFIFTLLTLGIFVGFCGRQPGSDYSNECCSRKTGSSFINCGIFFIFLTGGVLMVVSIAHFMLAGTLTQVICEAVYAQDNRTQDAFQLPRLRIDSRYKYEVPPYHDIVRECKNGASAYTAFQLQPVYNIEDITKLADRFKRKAKQLANQVTLPDDATANIVFLSPEAKQQLGRFSKSKITRVKFDSFADQLEESIVSVDLREVINRFNETIEDEDNFDMPDQIRTRLQNEILILESLQDKILTPMIADVRKAAESLRFLFIQQKDLAQRIESVADAAEKAQESLHSSGARQQVRQLAQEFEEKFVKHVEDYANFTFLSIRDHVGHCEPLYNSLNATTTTFCHKIGSPLSAFWFSLTCLILLFVPLLIVGMVLARLYRKYKYLGYESETYYSTYGDGDTIPLSLSANGRRQKRGREPSSHPHSHSSGAAAHARYQNRFEDTSQNLDPVLRPDSSSLPESAHRRPTNLRFIDTPSSHENNARLGGGFTSTNYYQKNASPSPSPPSYSEAIRYSNLTDEWGDDFIEDYEELPSSLCGGGLDPSSPFTSEDNTDNDGFSTSTNIHDEQLGAWGSQLVFNNHHTPPASGEYERPPPYYYPGPAN